MDQGEILILIALAAMLAPQIAVFIKTLFVKVKGKWRSEA